MKAPKGFIEYQEADLRFTGWEHECIIIDRTENHYFIPISRYNELQILELSPQKSPDIISGAGITGGSGTVGKN